ncbi:hypothetical protein ACGFX7_24405 [Streptomyces harbinensis]|uniref:hypothetical protein n=1 Tax=Streptomyces harbinensis TaxID=1176198 RepID=UPI003718CD1E
MLPKLPPLPGASLWKSVLVSVVLLVPLILIVLIFGVGVALPAVWSRSPERREAAFKVLKLIVSTFRSRWRRSR